MARLCGSSSPGKRETPSITANRTFERIRYSWSSTTLSKASTTATIASSWAIARTVRLQFFLCAVSGGAQSKLLYLKQYLKKFQEARPDLVDACRLARLK